MRLFPWALAVITVVSCLSMARIAIAAQKGAPPALMIARAAPADTRPGKVVPGFGDLPVVFSKEFAKGVTAPSTGPLRFLSLKGRLLTPGSLVPRGGVRLLPVAPGRAALRLKDGLFVVSVLSVTPRSRQDGKDVERRRLALSRSLPPELALSVASEQPDDEAVEFLFTGPTQALPSTIELIARGPQGLYVDALSRLPIVSAPCPQPPVTQDLSCAVTPRVRLSVDSVERTHSALSERTLMAEVGGNVLLRSDGQGLFSIPVGAPEALEPGGPGRYRVKLRTRILKTHPGGPPAVGTDAAEAKELVSQELASTSRLWGQCGITLGDPTEWDIEVVAPPDLTLLVVGCQTGFPASGGHVDLEVEGQRVVLNTNPGDSPERTAVRLAARLEALGLSVALHENPQVETAALPTFDLVVRRRAGGVASVRGGAGPAAPLSNDPTLGVCAVSLDLADGLEHFNDFDASAGTAEERVLLRSLMDDDPQTIDLFVVPVFSGTGRIGESFIYSPGVSLQNALILDRMGLRAGARSFTLAHELGHVLLALPGHPDDYGVDTPHSLMDADAADSTIFGPRRLSLSECRRALRQSGREAPVPLISDWALDSE